MKLQWTTLWKVRNCYDFVLSAHLSKKMPLFLTLKQNIMYWFDYTKLCKIIPTYGSFETGFSYFYNLALIILKKHGWQKKKWKRWHRGEGVQQKKCTQNFSVSIFSTTQFLLLCIPWGSGNITASYNKNLFKRLPVHLEQLFY